MKTIFKNKILNKFGKICFPGMMESSSLSEVSPTPKICIIACPRSGTRFSAKVLRTAGYDIQHEQLGEMGTSDYRKLGQRINPSFKIIHQVRHPLNCIASMQTLLNGTYKFLLRSIAIPYRELKENRRLEICARIWLFYNAQCEALAEATYRVESDSEWNDACARVGLPLIPRNEVRTTTNTRRQAAQFRHYFEHPLTLMDITREAGVHISRGIEKMAKRYGYTFEENP